jgi:hypothetical protein
MALWDDDPIVGPVKPKGPAWENDPIVGEAPSAPNVLKDVAKSAGAEYLKGVAGLLGAPADIAGLVTKGYDWAEQKIRGESADERRARTAEYDKNALIPPATMEKFGSHSIVEGLENLGGKLHKPETALGRGVGTIAGFVPGAVLGPGGPIRKLAAGALAPGVAAEAGGNLPGVKGTALEPWVRGGAAVIGGGAAALATAPRSAETALSRSLQGVDAGTVIPQAQALIDDAARMGVRLDWDEAIQQVTGGATRMGDLRRVVENSTGGGNVLKPLLAERPGQVQAAGDQAIGALAPNRLDPLRAGTGAQRAAEREIADAQAAINAATRADYGAAGRQRIGAPAQQAIETDPLYARALAEIRENPELSRGIANLPNDSVEVIDLAQRRMRELATNRRAPGEANTSNLAAANLEDARRAPIEVAEQVTGGRYGDYARARATQQTLRENILEPLDAGPIGKISRTTDITEQGKAILPNAPPPGSEQVVAEIVGRLARQNPDAAANVIHSHVRAAFDEATQALPTGPNQFGGAKFAAIVAGNGQQARNLQAGVEALHGPEAWRGFRRFVDVMEATGQRPQAGSATAYNTQLMKELSQSGNIAPELAGAAKTGGMSMFKRFNDYREQMNLGNNTAQIARILSDPRSGALLTRLATAPQSQWPVLALRLSYMGKQGARSAGPGARSTSEPTE